jgi:co-chaperonin GroES (HSP10)
VSVPFTPLADRVVIQADREDHAPVTTESGVVLAATMAAAVTGADTEDSWFVGTVLACGPDVDPLKAGFQVGNRVVFSWTSGQEIRIDGEKFLIMRASQVLALSGEDHGG